MEDLLYKLGLSNYQARLYKALVNLEEGTVSKIAKEAEIPTNKAYGDLEWLYENEFISLSSKKPLRYKIIDPEVVLQSKIERRINKLENLKDKTSEVVSNPKKTKKSSDVSILRGRDLFFSRMKKQLRNCENSVLATIGTSRVDSELLKIEEEVTSRGVDMRFIAGYNEDAVPRIKKHIDVGVNVRFSEQENVRFTVWDEEVITFRVHTENDEDYYSIWIESPALARIMKSYFNTVWESSFKKEEILNK